LKITHIGATDQEGRFSILSRAVKAAGLIYTAGATARKPDGTVPDGIIAQTEFVLTRLSEVLKESGASFADVIKVNISITDMADFPALNEVYRKHFPGPAPARATVAVAALASPALCVEIEMIAVDPGYK